MQGGRGNGNPFLGFGDPFANFGGFGRPGSLIPGFFGGRDPFDDPFFTQPFGGMFPPSLFGPSRGPFMDAPAPPFPQLGFPQHGFPQHGFPQPGFPQPGFPQHDPSPPTRSRGPIIEELDSDDETVAAEGSQERKENPRKHGRSGREPFVVEPDDEAEGRRRKQLYNRSELNNMRSLEPRPQAHSFTFQSSSVTYGGANGAYYTSSTTKRSGSDGLTFEEHKEADSSTGQAAHRLSRGIHNKGHSVSRKLNPDGRVDTMQTLHNINEDELSGFEEAWNGKAQKHLPGWIGGVNSHEGGSYGDSQRRLPSRSGLALPSNEPLNRVGHMRPDMQQFEVGSTHSRQPGRMRAETGEKGESSKGYGAAARTSKNKKY